MDPKDTNEIQIQSEDLVVAKGMVRESLRPYVVPTLLVTYKDDNMSMCTNKKAINKIIIKPMHPTLRF